MGHHAHLAHFYMSDSVWAALSAVPFLASRSTRRAAAYKLDRRGNENHFATDGATLQSATLDGARVAAATGAERGHPTFQVDVEVPRRHP